MVIPCINYYDNTIPPHCEYSLERIPTEGVNMNLDPAFLAGCDCEDDCLVRALSQLKINIFLHSSHSSG